VHQHAKREIQQEGMQRPERSRHKSAEGLPRIGNRIDRPGSVTTRGHGFAQLLRSFPALPLRLTHCSLGDGSIDDVAFDDLTPLECIHHETPLTRPEPLLLVIAECGKAPPDEPAGLSRI
jgi:hypothetical protein